MTPPPGAACTAILSEISGYLEGELDATRCDAIDAHCAGCPECAALVRGLRDTIGLCRGAAAAPIPDAVREKARSSVLALLRGESGGT